jgi:hypothetical protein
VAARGAPLARAAAAALLSAACGGLIEEGTGEQGTGEPADGAPVLTPAEGAAVPGASAAVAPDRGTLPGCGCAPAGGVRLKSDDGVFEFGEPPPLELLPEALRSCRPEAPVFVQEGCGESSHLVACDAALGCVVVEGTSRLTWLEEHSVLQVPGLSGSLRYEPPSGEGSFDLSGEDGAAYSGRFSVCELSRPPC